MEITQVRVFPVDEDKLKAFASIIFDDCFVVSDIKVIDGNHGMFISMPSKKRRNGSFRDIAHPLNNETRKLIEDYVDTNPKFHPDEKLILFDLVEKATAHFASKR